jgi:hypothetical protein
MSPDYEVRVSIVRRLAAIVEVGKLTLQDD